MEPGYFLAYTVDVWLSAHNMTQATLIGTVRELALKCDAFKMLVVVLFFEN